MKDSDLRKLPCGMTLCTASRRTWNCELAEHVFDTSFDGRDKKTLRVIDDEDIHDFLQVISTYPIEDLVSGQAYHDKQKKLIGIVVKPIKTTFITSYHMRSSEGTKLFPGHSED